MDAAIAVGYHSAVHTVSKNAAADPASILVVLPAWVGDFVMATPALRAIRTRFPNARITALGEQNLRDLVRGGNWFDELLEWPTRHQRNPWHRPFRDLVHELRNRRIDLAIMLPNSFRSALVARLAGAKRRVGLDRDGRGWLLTDRVPVANRANGAFMPSPIVESYADLIEAIGCPRSGDGLELFTTAADDEIVQTRLASAGIADHHPLVVVSPGARYGAAKMWLPDRFAAVADRLFETMSAAVIVTCGPGEEPIAREIGSAMRHEGIVLHDPLLTLGGLKSLIRRSDLLLCNDAGPRHFAKAFGVPVVTIFGPTHPEWTATTYARERIVRIDVDCGPCQQRTCPLTHVDCMTGVSVEAVFEACCELLKDVAPVGNR